MISYFPYYIDNYILYDELFSYDGTSFYSAKNQHLDIDYIIKVFPKDQKRMKDRFINEISMLKKLNHRNIAHIYFHCENEQYFFIVFESWKCILKESIEQTNIMKDATKKKSFIINDNNIIMQILNGVNYCHQNGIIHFNLNLWTIVIDHYDNVKLIGFDFAFYAKNASQNMLSSSLVEFVPPEIIMKLPNPPSFSADIWSLGVIFYFINVGKSPWQNASDKKQKIKLIESGKVNITTKKDFSLTFVLHSMLVVNPEMRKPVDQIIVFFEKNLISEQLSSVGSLTCQNENDDSSAAKRSCVKRKMAFNTRDHRMSCPYGMIHFLNKQSLI